jgi:hypothetical protein
VVHTPQDSPQLADALKLFQVLSEAYGWRDADIASALRIENQLCANMSLATAL